MRFWIGNASGGVLVSKEFAKVSVTDHGFTVADGVFETLKVINGTPFALTRHLARLHRSADGLGLTLPSDDDIRAAVADVLAAPEAGIERMRITVTSGEGPMGSERGDSDWTLVVTSAPTNPWPPSATLAIVPWKKYEHSALTGLKTTSYAENVVALNFARRRGADEAVFANSQDMLCEGASSNIFAVVDGELITPTLDSGALGGITRALALQWCDIRERDITLDQFLTATEVFISSSTRDLQPVSTVIDLDGSEHALPCPGPHSHQAMAAFAAHASKDLDP